MKNPRYLLRFANTQEYVPADVRSILQKCRKVVGQTITVGDVRISSRAVEVDTFIPRGERETEVAKTIARFVGPLIGIRPISDSEAVLTKKESLKRGVELFNQERFWECHELLETVWKREKGRERDLVQSIILAAAAFVHFQKNQETVGLGVARRAISKMKWSSPSYHGVDVGRLRADLDNILRSNKMKVFKIHSSFR